MGNLRRLKVSLAKTLVIKTYKFTYDLLTVIKKNINVTFV